MTTNVIDNSTLVKEEKLGYASQYLVRHETAINDAQVRAMITNMSIKEIIS